MTNPLLRGGGGVGVGGGTSNPLAGDGASVGSLSSSRLCAASASPTESSDSPYADLLDSLTSGDKPAAAVDAEGPAEISAADEMAAGAIEEDRLTGFRKIGNDGVLQTDGVEVPLRRALRLMPQVEADRGQTNVGGPLVSTPLALWRVAKSVDTASAYFLLLKEGSSP